MFTPPFCPYAACVSHRRPRRDFCIRFGRYTARCRAVPVPRFRCRRCRRTFSRQTFRADFRLKKPWLTEILWDRFTSGVSLRQTARALHIARRTVEDRLVRFGRHAERLHQNLLRHLRAAGRFQLDELETYEHHRILKPLTAAVLLQENSWFLVDSAVGLLRSRATQHPRSQARRARFEAKHGRRRNGSRHVVTQVLRCLKDVTAGRPLTLVSDEKLLYGSVLRAVFGMEAVRHERTSSRQPRTPWNPLFPINHMEAMLRYGLSRLIRQSFCGSKKGRNLEYHLALHRVWWNCWRWRTNRSRKTPAMAAGLLARRLDLAELFGWRQDFGARSLLPDALRA